MEQSLGQSGSILMTGDRRVGPPQPSHMSSLGPHPVISSPVPLFPHLWLESELGCGRSVNVSSHHHHHHHHLHQTHKVRPLEPPLAGPVFSSLQQWGQVSTRERL